MFGELWAEKAMRLKAASPFGRLAGWSVRSVIFKGGDDLRQESLAMQCLELLNAVWTEARLPLRLTPYAVFVTSGHSGLIETVPDAQSLDGIKKAAPPDTTLLELFKLFWGGNAFELEQKRSNFTESLAAYCLFTYLLQVKDRHNGNIMMTSDGRLVHIDFGFMLTNSPGGNINFEACPFKLTTEYVQVMGNQISYFRMLLVSGLAQARAHAEKLILLVKLMEEGNSMSCFALPHAAQGLRDRLYLELPDAALPALVAGMIDESLDNWRTNQYDAFQKLSNGILT